MSSQALAEKGYGAVAFDYRSFGLSDGQPRNMLSSSDQLQDYRSVISYIRRADSPFDPTRVAVWGFSFGGAHVTRLATDPGLVRLTLCPPAVTDSLKDDRVSSRPSPSRRRRIRCARRPG